MTSILDEINAVDALRGPTKPVLSGSVVSIGATAGGLYLSYRVKLSSGAVVAARGLAGIKVGSHVKIQGAGGLYIIIESRSPAAFTVKRVKV